MAAATPASAATAVMIEAYYVLSMYIEFNEFDTCQGRIWKCFCQGAKWELTKKLQGLKLGKAALAEGLKLPISIHLLLLIQFQWGD